LVAPFAGQLSGYGYELLRPVGRRSNRKAQALLDWLVKSACAELPAASSGPVGAAP
jgi:hypothetical protein